MASQYRPYGLTERLATLSMAGAAIPFAYSKIRQTIDNFNEVGYRFDLIREREAAQKIYEAQGLAQGRAKDAILRSAADDEMHYELTNRQAATLAKKNIGGSYFPGFANYGLGESSKLVPEKSMWTKLLYDPFFGRNSKESDPPSTSKNIVLATDGAPEFLNVNLDNENSGSQVIDGDYGNNGSQVIDEIPDNSNLRFESIPNNLSNSQPINPSSYWPKLENISTSHLVGVSAGVLVTLAAAYWYYNRGKIMAGYEFRNSVQIDGVEYQNVLLNKKGQIILDYKERPLINLTTDSKGVFLFRGQPIVVESSRQLTSLQGEPLMMDKNGIKDSQGNNYRYSPM